MVATRRQRRQTQQTQPRRRRGRVKVSNPRLIGKRTPGWLLSGLQTLGYWWNHNGVLLATWGPEEMDPVAVDTYNNMDQVVRPLVRFAGVQA